METREFSKLVKNQDENLIGLSKDMQFKHWAMDKGHNIAYQNDNFHTLSLYLKGGNNNARLDVPTHNGMTGTFCFMPQEQDSIWQINERVEFAHIYISQKLIKRFVTSNYEIDARFIELKDQTFLNDPNLMSHFLRCFKANQVSKNTSNIRREELAYQLVSYMVEQFNTSKIDGSKVKGGLSPVHRKTVLNQITDTLNEKITINTLARSVNLSPYHFAKMFKISFGESPASYINWMRVEKVKRLLKTNSRLAEISQAVGFNNQSHMTQSFKQLTGITPGRYRANY